VAGIAALIYFVGAVIMWIRLRSVGLPPDVAAASSLRVDSVT
jgi:hypothetical protein